MFEKKRYEKDEDLSLKNQFIYGIHPIEEAIKSGKEIDKIYIQKGIRSDAIYGLFGMIKKDSIPFQYVPIEKLNRLRPGANHQGVMASLSLISYQPFEEVLAQVYEAGKTPFFLLLDRVTDVRNIGAIARTAECAGVQAILVPSQNSAQLNSDAVKSSAGALLRMPICRLQNMKTTIHYLKESGLQIVAATEKSNQLIYDCDLTKPTAVIMGSEEDGISAEFLKLADFKAKIPLAGDISSLNVSVAAGIILFEAVKQKLGTE